MESTGIRSEATGKAPIPQQVWRVWGVDLKRHAYPRWELRTPMIRRTRSVCGRRAWVCFLFVDQSLDHDRCPRCDELLLGEAFD